MKYYSNNLISLINLISAAQNNNVHDLVFSSSCSVYGEPDKLPVDENSPLKKAESPYGYTKQVCERILQDVCNATDFKTIALRYFNPAGAHDSALIGEYPFNPPASLCSCYKHKLQLAYEKKCRYSETITTHPTEQPFVITFMWWMWPKAACIGHSAIV